MPLKFPLRPEQETAVQVARASLAEKQRLALDAPTGSGKSLVEAVLLLDGNTVAAPSMDICDGIASSAGIDTQGSEAARRKRYEAVGLFTYKRLHTFLAEGGSVRGLVLDEGHHLTCDTLQEIAAMCPGAGIVLLTATLYRGTPDQTAQLLAAVGGNTHKILTLHDAVKRGRISLPTFDVLPLMDDETVEVSSGEFTVRGCERLAATAMEALVAEIVSREVADGKWKQPGTLVLPGVASVAEYAAAFASYGVETVSVLGDTRNRRVLFNRVIACDALLLQVRAVGEGTDLPLRFMYDASPTMSPPLWMQRVGRICRPGDVTPRYITTCHNLLRHGYLWEGLVPRAAFAKSVSVWGDGFTPSRRTVCRAMGMTGFGRFLPTEVRLASGETAFLYALSSKDGFRQAAALLIPAQPKPLYFFRQLHGTGEMVSFSPKPGVNVTYERKEGTWKMVDTLPDLTDCVSLPSSPLTPNMKRWWNNAAARKGLAADWQPTAKEFCVLPILTDCGVKIA